MTSHVQREEPAFVFLCTADAATHILPHCPPATFPVTWWLDQPSYCALVDGAQGESKHSTNQHHFLPLYIRFLCKRQIGLRDFNYSVLDYFYALLFLLDIYILYIYIYQRVYIRCIHQNHQAGNNTRVFWHQYRKVKVALVFRQFYFYRHFSPRALLQTWLFRCLGNQYMSIVQNGSCARGIPEASTQDRSAPVPREVLFAALAGLQRRYPPQTPQPSPRSTALTLPRELGRANPAAVLPPTCEVRDVPVAYPVLALHSILCAASDVGDPREPCAR